MTLAAVAAGYSAVATFQGFISGVYQGLALSAIQGERLGHISIFRGGPGRDPRMRLFPNETVSILRRELGRDPDIAIVTPRLSIAGLLSNGRRSAIFVAEGIDPADEERMRFRSIQGKGLGTDKPRDVEVSSGLARMLGLETGSEAVVFSTTISGQMNALDVRVARIFDTGYRFTNDKSMRVSLDLARALYDTKGADRLVVFLKKGRNSAAVIERLGRRLSALGIEAEIRSWKELSAYYVRVKRMFDMIFAFLFTIVLAIVVMSIINVMGISVLERTREIGTLRALGLKPHRVRRLFVIEGGLIGLLGSLSGIWITLCIWAAVQIIHPLYSPPGTSSPVPFRINLLPFGFPIYTLLFTFLASTAAFIPARRAVRMNIVKALRAI